MINKIDPLTGLTFDDVLLIPGESTVKRDEIDVTAKLGENITLRVPVLSSPMDTVTGWELAKALSDAGGLGIIHRNFSVEGQVEAINKLLREESSALFGAAVGVGDDFPERVSALIHAGAKVLLIDSAQGYSKYVLEATGFIKKSYPGVFLISGNVATYDGAKTLIEAGADALRIGMGPGSICTTRIIAGIGVPQITAIMECAKAAAGRPKRIPLIADGGIRSSGDIVKALAAGASAVMLGSLFAGCLEAPGEVIEKEGKKYKAYRGMGSLSAMMEGSAARYGQNYKKGQEKKLIPEGVEGMVSLTDTVADKVNNLMGGLKSGMYYTGTRTIGELQENTRFMRITHASLIESYPHDIVFK